MHIRFKQGGNLTIQRKIMKAFKIFSPAYKANGLNGTYCSIAICNDNGDFEKVIGDHANGRIGSFFFPEYKNIYEMVGMPFSDSDRFIEIKEINIDLAALTTWEEKYTNYYKESEDYKRRLIELCKGDVYSFLYNNKGAIKENHETYNTWMKNNPHPTTEVNYYDFLKCDADVE